MFTTPGLQKYIDGSTVLNTKKFGILPGLVDPDVLQSRLYREWKVQMKVLPISMYAVGQTTRILLWDNIKMYHSGHFLD
jgi:hypothetical protein